MAVPHRQPRRCPRGLSGRPMVRWHASDRIRVLHRGRHELPTTGNRADPGHGIAEPVRETGRNARVRGNDGGERRVPRSVRFPRIREGTPPSAPTVVWLARPLRRAADGACAPRGAHGTHFHRPLPQGPSSTLRRLAYVSGGESATHGWIIDAYGDYDRDSMVLWLWNERGAHRI